MSKRDDKHSEKLLVCISLVQLLLILAFVMLFFFVKVLFTHTFELTALTAIACIACVKS